MAVVFEDDSTSLLLALNSSGLLDPGNVWIFSDSMDPYGAISLSPQPEVPVDSPVTLFKALRPYL